MKKLLALMLAVVLSLGLASCSAEDGIAQEDYETLQAEYEALQSEYDKLTTELDALNNSINKSSTAAFDYGKLTTGEFHDFSFSYGENLTYIIEDSNYGYVYFNNTTFVMFMAAEIDSADLDMDIANTVFEATEIEFSEIEEIAINGEPAFRVSDALYSSDDLIVDQYISMVLFKVNSHPYTLTYTAPAEIYQIHYDHYLSIIDSIEEIALPTEDAGNKDGENDQTTVTPSPSPSPEPTASITIGQSNALSKAKDYLDYTAFSYSGLVEQLEYEGFSNEEAVYGADNCGADWNEQAAKKAKEYLDYTAFSRSGLIEQLEYEGFTNAQAVYGVEANGY